MARLETVARINRWSQLEMADYLLVALKGQALELVCSRSQESQSNYADLLKALECQFRSERQRV